MSGWCFSVVIGLVLRAIIQIVPKLVLRSLAIEPPKAVWCTHRWNKTHNMHYSVPHYSYIMLYRCVPHLFLHFLVLAFTKSSVKMQFWQKLLSEFLVQRCKYIGIDTHSKKEENCHFGGVPYFLTTWPTLAKILYPMGGADRGN